MLLIRIDEPDLAGESSRIESDDLLYASPQSGQRVAMITLSDLGWDYRLGNALILLQRCISHIIGCGQTHPMMTVPSSSHTDPSSGQCCVSSRVGGVQVVDLSDPGSEHSCLLAMTTPPASSTPAVFVRWHQWDGSPCEDVGGREVMTPRVDASLSRLTYTHSNRSLIRARNWLRSMSELIDQYVQVGETSSSSSSRCISFASLSPGATGLRLVLSHPIVVLPESPDSHRVILVAGGNVSMTQNWKPPSQTNTDDFSCCVDCFELLAFQPPIGIHPSEDVLKEALDRPPLYRELLFDNPRQTQVAGLDPVVEPLNFSITVSPQLNSLSLFLSLMEDANQSPNVMTILVNCAIPCSYQGP